MKTLTPATRKRVLRAVVIYAIAVALLLNWVGLGGAWKALLSIVIGVAIGSDLGYYFAFSALSARLAAVEERLKRATRICYGFNPDDTSADEYIAAKGAL